MQLSTTSSIKHHEFPLSTLSNALNLVIYGVKASRFSLKRKVFKPTSLYLLEEDPTILQWISESQPFSKTRFFLRNIRDITENPSFSAISLLFKEKTEKNLLCLDLGEEKFFALGFFTRKAKELFWQGLQYHLKKLETQKNRNIEGISKDLFINFDENGDNILSKEESRNLLIKLHISMNSSEFEALFKKFDRNSNGFIEFNEFLELMRERLYKPELERIFRKHCKLANFTEKKQGNLEEKKKFSKNFRKNADIPMMTFEEIQRFFAVFQKENLTEKQLKALLDPFFIDKKETRDFSLSFLTFCNLVFSWENSVFDPFHETIYQVN